MPKFIAIRHGSNGANQSMCERMVLATIISEDEEQAEEAARDHFTFYNNQQLEIIAARDASRSDKLDAMAGLVINLIEMDRDLDNWATA